MYSDPNDCYFHDFNQLEAVIERLIGSRAHLAFFNFKIYGVPVKGCEQFTVD